MSSSTDAETLADLLLKVAGLDISREGQARRDVRVLAAAIPLMREEQSAEAMRRIHRAETRWGPLLSDRGEINCTAQETAPERRIIWWLSRHKNPKRLLPVLQRAAERVNIGDGPALAEIMECAFGQETDRVVHTVQGHRFREWMLELRVATPIKNSGRVRWYPAQLTDILADQPKDAVKRWLAGTK